MGAGERRDRLDLDRRPPARRPRCRRVRPAAGQRDPGKDPARMGEDRHADRVVDRLTLVAQRLRADPTSPVRRRRPGDRPRPRTASRSRSASARPARGEGIALQGRRRSVRRRTPRSRAIASSRIQRVGAAVAVISAMVILPFSVFAIALPARSPQLAATPRRAFRSCPERFPPARGLASFTRGRSLTSSTAAVIAASSSSSPISTWRCVRHSGGQNRTRARAAREQEQARDGRPGR